MSPIDVMVSQQLLSPYGVLWINTLTLQCIADPSVTTVAASSLLLKLKSYNDIGYYIAKITGNKQLKN